MAIAIPILMSATGASAAIGAAVGLSAAAVTTLTTITFAVTGISEKINKAASKVFGEDLVMVGNIFGAAYGAFSGAFGATDGAAAAGDAAGFVGEGAASGVPGWDAAYSAAGGEMGSLADLAGGMDYGGTETLLNEADAIEQMGGDRASFLEGTDAAESVSAVEKAVTNPIAQAEATGNPASLLPKTGAASAQAGSTQAAGAQVAPPQAAAPNAAAPVNAPRSFFNRLMFDEKGGINPTTLRVGGQVLAGYGKSAQEQKLLDQKIAEQRRRSNQSSGVRVTR